jgi:spore maturation protein SpmA
MGPIFLFLVVTAVIWGFGTGNLEALSRASVDSANKAFMDVALPLVGMMTLWLGLVEVVKRGGLMDAIGRALRPVFRWLFPEIPDGHPALSAMTLNIAANMLGLTNAATPFGIQAVRQLDRLNGEKGTATNAMALFLAINTSGVSLLPTGAIGVRAALGSKDPAGILFTTLMATTLSTLTAIVACKLLMRIPRFAKTQPPVVDDTGATDIPDSLKADPDPAARWNRTRVMIALALFAAAGVAAAMSIGGIAQTVGWLSAGRAAASYVPLPMLMLAIVLYGWSRSIEVYGSLVEGAKEGFQVAVRITPYLVAVLVAVGMFRASGAFDALVSVLAPLTTPLGFPIEALPMALIRPLSGSGALAIMTETMQNYGTDSFVGYLVSTLQGSFETTFYVLAVYGGAIGMRRTRHTLPACLIGDLAGIIGATVACYLMVGVR